MPTEAVLFVTTAYSYRTRDFVAAAEALGMPWFAISEAPVAGIDAQHVHLCTPSDWQAVATWLATMHPHHYRFVAVHALDDSGAETAVRIAMHLGLTYNRPDAVEAARNKWVMRQRMAHAAVPMPQCQRFTSQDDLATVQSAITFPCVIKPTELNGSRGVIRANNVAEFEVAQMRLMRLLRDIYPHQAVHEYLVETYIPGVEVAVEGMMDAGVLHVLALFDKPDPLEGPFFEETIYVTPSRLTDAQQQQIATVTATAAQSLGIMSGPVHAELRLNDAGCFVIEIAARSIGGLCSRTLRFGTAESLEMLIVRQSVGMWHEAPARQQNAGGVMMIPIPAAGILRRVNGVAQAEQVPLIESIEITAPMHHPIRMLPEGDSYLGFIFARGPHATDVEAALRQAHACLQFDIMPAIQLA